MASLRLKCLLHEWQIHHWLLLTISNACLKISTINCRFELQFLLRASFHCFQLSLSAEVFCLQTSLASNFLTSLHQPPYFFPYISQRSQFSINLGKICINHTFRLLAMFTTCLQEHLLSCLFQQVALHDYQFGLSQLLLT